MTVVAESLARFEEATADHTMIVRRDDGLYRHLKFGKPGTSVYSFDLITWPGYLAVVGDCGDFVFSRVADMFEFFEGTLINPDYWAGKLQAPRPEDVKRFSPGKFEKRVQEWLQDAVVDLTDDAAASLAKAVQGDLLRGDVDSAHAAYELLNDFEFAGKRIYDFFEWDCREFDFHFLFCCWAVVWGIAKYREATSTTSSSAALPSGVSRG